MSALRKIARRTFLIGSSAIAGGVAFGVYAYRKPPDNPLRAAEGEAVFNPYVKIASDETITVVVPRAEMGQGVTTTLAALVAEELDVALSAITVEHGPAAAAYANTTMLAEGLPFPAYDQTLLAEAARGGMEIVGKFLGLHVTGGSTSTIDAFEKMREAGASARETLKQAAATRWGVDAATLRTAEGRVSEPSSGQSASYGELAREAADFPAARAGALRSPSEWKILGKPQRRTDMRAKVTGAPIYGTDVSLPDMLHATVKMNPHLGGRMLRMDPERALALEGVISVLPIDHALGHGFAVVADNTWRAFKAADLVDVEWEQGPFPEDEAGIWRVMRDTLEAEEGSPARDDGDIETGFADAPRERVLSAEYSVPYLAHATMEPMNATARLKDGRLEIWAPNQSPNLVQTVAARAVGIDADDCEVHTTYLGGGFGRRGDVDYAVLAALVARETGGLPVKVTWTREEDVTHDMYRPAALGQFRALIGSDGMPEAIDMKIAAPSVIGSVVPRFFPNISPPAPDISIVDGSYNQPYALDHYRVSGVKVPLQIPVGFWRSVGNSFNGFFHECFLDEIAFNGGLDPLDMRLTLMEPWPVAAALLEKVAEMSEWRRPAPRGRARGLAFTLSFGTWVAQVVEIEETVRGIRITDVWCAADGGLVLDPDIFKDQISSGIVFGLSSAMSQEITFAGGRVVQSNFHDFDAMRLHQCPAIHVELLSNSQRMGGAGEPGTPPAIPALANAVFALTGMRARRMPLTRYVVFA